MSSLSLSASSCGFFSGWVCGSRGRHALFPPKGEEKKSKVEQERHDARLRLAERAAVTQARRFPSCDRRVRESHRLHRRVLEVRTTDYHTAGEPFRIVTGGAPEIPGATVRDRREHARASAEVDRVRRLLCHEPRGHADMYGCFLGPARRRRRPARRAVLAQGRLLDGVRARDDRARRVGRRVRPRRGRRRRRDRRADRRPVRPGRRARALRGRRGRRTSPSATCRRTCSRATCRWRRRSGPCGSTSPTAARSTPASPASAAGLAVDPGGVRGPDRARPGDQGRARGHRARPPSERRPAVRDLRDDRLRRPRRHRGRAAPAQRDGLRRRRGRPLAVRVGHLRAGRAAARRRPPRARARSSRTTRSSARAFAATVRDVVRAEGRDAVRRRGRAARPTAPASTASCSTPATRSGPASCCGERAAVPRRRPPSRALSPREAVDALEAALRAGLDPDADPPRQAVGTEAGELLIMPSASPGAAGVKLVTVAPGNPERGLPRIQGVYVLFDPATLAPGRAVDGIALTNLRTAAVSALAVRHLAAPARAAPARVRHRRAGLGARRRAAGGRAGPRARRRRRARPRPRRRVRRALRARARARRPGGRADGGPRRRPDRLRDDRPRAAVRRRARPRRRHGRRDRLARAGRPRGRRDARRRGDGRRRVARRPRCARRAT